MKKYIALLLTFFTFCSKKINFFYFLLKIYHLSLGRTDKFWMSIQFFFSASQKRPFM